MRRILMCVRIFHLRTSGRGKPLPYITTKNAATQFSVLARILRMPQTRVHAALRQ